MFRAEGIRGLTDVRMSDEYTVDVEMWDLGSQQLCRERLDEIQTYVESGGGRVTDNYVGESLVLMRTTCTGQTVRGLMRMESIALVDLPPKPRVSLGELLEMSVGDFPDVTPPAENAPSIGVLDSGVAAGHPLLAPAVGEATTSPLSWRDGSDGHGHGTMVCGLALYGDIERCIREGSFAPSLKLFSSRVLNSSLGFDDERLITSQMRDAIKYFTEEYGCRVFNLSLGDPRLPYRGGKVSPWAAILDTLARELNVVIVVSAGNYQHDPGQQAAPAGHLRDYPRYLLSDEARIIEPATGAIVLSVGALSHTAGISPTPTTQRVTLRPIALEDQPSPFTRSGPGLGKAVKPELVEYGGNLAYDATLGQSRLNPPVADLSVVSLNREYSVRLFTTNIGTSFAAPRVAHAAARLLETFPEASANLVRALLVSSASVPEASSLAVGSLGDDAIARICGYGQPDLHRARVCDRNRVVLYAEAEIGLDNFHIYEVPIPDDFIDTNGERRIAVTLAFDPPVRHSRFDYLGVKMSFRLIRGKELQEVADAFRKLARDEGEVDRLSSTRYDCKMRPGPAAREGGTLQRGVFTMRVAPRDDYGETYYLVVRCERRWARDDQGPQRYAVTVVMDHRANINLYNTIRQRVRAAVRVRAR